MVLQTKTPQFLLRHPVKSGDFRQPIAQRGDDGGSFESLAQGNGGEGHRGVLGKSGGGRDSKKQGDGKGFLH